MSIARRQITNAINKIIKESLQDGFFPTATQIITKLNRYFQGKVLGQPTMKLRLANSRKQSSSEDWNKTIDEIHEDLSILYEESNDQVIRILSDFDFAETERRKLYNQLNKLENKMKNYLLLNDNLDGYLYSAYDSFEDLSKVNTTQSNTFVDLEMGYVIPKPIRTGSNKVDLSGASISKEIETPVEILSQEVISQFDRCLDDNIDSAWIERIKVKNQTPIIYKILINLDSQNITNVTRLAIKTHDGRRVLIDVAISEDGFNWTNLRTSDVGGTVSWDFPEIKVKSIRIRLTKNENDPEITEGGYYYTFGLKDISLSKMGYEETGILVSQPHRIVNRQGDDINLSKLSLEVEEEKPTGTEINYYLAIDTGGSPDWQPISPVSEPIPAHPKVIDLKSIGLSEPVHLYNTATRHPAPPPGMEAPLFNGMPFYSITAIAQQNLIERSVVLYKGVNQWKQEKYIFEWDEDIHVPSLNDWINLPTKTLGNTKTVITRENINATYINADIASDTPNGVEELVAGDQHGNYRWSISLYSEDEKKINGSISLSSPGGPGYIVVYVNNQEVKKQNLSAGSRTSISYKLNPGWNSIQILFYNKSGVSTIINPGFLPHEHAQSVRAEIDPMTRVDIFDLYYNVRDLETNYYAIDNNRIVINEATKNEGPRFELGYRYYLTNNNNSVLFRADFRKPAGVEAPPRLLSYRIRAMD